MRKITICVLTGCFLIAVMCYGADKAVSGKSARKIKLPAPQSTGGMPLMEALSKRQSSRSYSPKKLTEQVLSNLLWAACGVNRAESGKRTAPSAVNWQEIDVYIAMEDGLYCFNAKEQSLEKILSEDIRAATGGQPFVKDAPVNLIYVANYSRMSGDKSRKDFYAAADTGFISQNVYLFCASEGLATVVRGMVSKKELAGLMKLKAGQEIILSQTVGYPKEK